MGRKLASWQAGKLARQSRDLADEWTHPVFDRNPACFCQMAS
jgi:hypothetical protein